MYRLGGSKRTAGIRSTKQRANANGNCASLRCPKDTRADRAGRGTASRVADRKASLFPWWATAAPVAAVVDSRVAFFGDPQGRPETSQNAFNSARGSSGGMTGDDVDEAVQNA